MTERGPYEKLLIEHFKSMRASDIQSELTIADEEIRYHLNGINLMSDERTTHTKEGMCLSVLIRLMEFAPAGMMPVATTMNILKIDSMLFGQWRDGIARAFEEEYARRTPAIAWAAVPPNIPATGWPSSPATATPAEVGQPGNAIASVNAMNPQLIREIANAAAENFLNALTGNK